MYYLKRKIMRKKLQFEAISELNIYKFLPGDLKDNSCLRSKDLEVFFFCPREKKYASGARTNRSTPGGYWKTTGNDRTVVYNERTVGMVKTLVFHLGQAPHGERTDWVMHEYRFEDKDLADAEVVQDAYVLCKVFKKSGRGPQNGAQYGAPFNEDDYDEEGICCAESSSAVDSLAPHLVSLPSNLNGSSSSTMIGPGNMNSGSFCEPRPSSTAGPSVTEVSPVNDVDMKSLAPHLVLLPNKPNGSSSSTMIGPGNMNSGSFCEPGPSSTAGPSVTEVSPVNDVVMNSLLAIFTVDGTSLPVEFDNTEDREALNPEENNADVNYSDGNDDIYTGLGELGGNLVDPSYGGFNVEEEAGYYNPSIHMPVDDDDTAYLELNDLNTPLRLASAEASVFAAAHLPSVSSSSSYAPYSGYDVSGQFPFEDNLFGPSAQNASGLPPLPESLGNHFDSLKENGIGSGANQEEFTTSRDMYFTPRQVEGSNRASSQAQIRGEKQRKPVMNGGSSINIKAEVTPRIDGCTKDALSLNLGEFSSTTTWKKTAASWSPSFNLNLGMIFASSIGLHSYVFGISFILEITYTPYFWIYLIMITFNHWICIIKVIISSVIKFI